MSYSVTPRNSTPVIDSIDNIVSNVANNVVLSPGESIQIYRQNYWQGIFALNCSENGLMWPGDLTVMGTAVFCSDHACNSLHDPLNRTMDVNRTPSMNVNVNPGVLGCSNSSIPSKTVAVSFFPSFALFPINESLFSSPSSLDTTGVFDLKIDGVEFGSTLPTPFTYVSQRVTESNQPPSCVYYNASSPTWSSPGCSVVSFNSTSVTCSCNHLTSFALLLLSLIHI